MKAGLREAFDRLADIIVFLDADIRNLTPEHVSQIVLNYYPSIPANGKARSY